MNEKRNPLTPKGKGFLQDLILQARLIIKLIGDKEVNFFLKLIPIAALVYVILPIDIIPEIAIPVIGYLDDAAVLWLSTQLFLALCPEVVVTKYREELERVVPGSWRDAPKKESSEIQLKDPGEPSEKKE